MHVCRLKGLISARPRPVLSSLPPPPPYQMLPQPTVAPNLSKLTVIAEDSLRLEEVLGSGAFGTVHKGYWRPEGKDIEYMVAVKMLKESTAAEATSELLNVSDIHVCSSVHWVCLYTHCYVLPDALHLVCMSVSSCRKVQ